MSEILQKASDAPTKEERINILRQNDHITFRKMLNLTFNPAVKWLIPKDIKYKACPDPYDQKTALYNYINKMYLFVEGGHPNLQQKKREDLFVDILEVIDPEDAKMLVSMTQKKLPYNFMTKNLIEEAFPDLYNN